jgi:threonyl-tRNA synthetase
MIVVGSKEADNDTVSLRITNQPNFMPTVQMLKAASNMDFTEKELHAGINLPLDVARKYFENLANAFM